MQSLNPHFSLTRAYYCYYYLQCTHEKTGTKNCNDLSKVTQQDRGSARFPKPDPQPLPCSVIWDQPSQHAGFGKCPTLGQRALPSKMILLLDFMHEQL